ncbi:peptidoglycan DD-metalloendopeptidase family protein [Raineya sp.]|jgi:murein DD-endopeptidase MepM/ murein hydrolase activator NlpD
MIDLAPKHIATFLFLFFCFVRLDFSVVAQKPSYVFPVKPDDSTYSQIILSGNVGEIRPNHFHCGLDVVGEDYEPIHSIYKGYVSRIKVSSYGYGNVVYITHPETDHVSVYAHLIDFSPKIRKYVRQKQYEQESFEVELFPSPEELPIEPKETIGYMGNTGNSFGTHLHFEIRTIADFVLNPQDFFAVQKHDKMPPRLLKVAVSPLSPESRVNGKFQTQIFTPVPSSKGLKIPQKIKCYGLVGIEGLTWDVVNGSKSSFATSKVRLRVEGKEVFSFHITNFPIYEIYALNLHINYALLLQSRSTFQRFYQADGNRLGIYKGNGKIFVENGKNYDVEVDLEDTNGNNRTLELTLQGEKPDFDETDELLATGILSYDIVENTLVVRGKYLMKPKAKGSIELILQDGKSLKIPLAYIEKGKEAIFLYDLRKGLPKLIRSQNIEIPFHKQVIFPKRNSFFENEFMRVYFPNGTLADTAYLDFSAKTTHFYIGKIEEPLVWDAEITYHHQKNNVSSVLDLKKMFIRHSRGREFLENLNDSTFTIRTGYLTGDFRFLQDTTPPTIRLLRKTSEKLIFQISDDASGISHFKAYLNGKFLLMEYEHKNATLWTETHYTETLAGEFELKVWDKMGNVQVWKMIL